MNLKTETPEIQVIAVCHHCRVKHVYRVQVPHLSQAMVEWTSKHTGHFIEFSRPRPLYTGGWRRRLREFWSDSPFFAPPGYGYGDNADMKLAYVAGADYVITLAGLPSSSVRAAGRESSVMDNTVNKYLDYLIGGKITIGGTPSANTQVDLWVFGSYKDTPLFPPPIAGTGDAALTFQTTHGRNSAMRPLVTLIQPDVAGARTYGISPQSLAGVFGGQVPMRHGLFVTHNTATNLDSTPANHQLTAVPLFGTVT